MRGTRGGGGGRESAGAEYSAFHLRFVDVYTLIISLTEDLNFDGFFLYIGGGLCCGLNNSLYLLLPN
jgi:hypothetical protein